MGPTTRTRLRHPRVLLLCDFSRGFPRAEKGRGLGSIFPGFPCLPSLVKSCSVFVTSCATVDCDSARTSRGRCGKGPRLDYHLPLTDLPSTSVFPSGRDPYPG